MGCKTIETTIDGKSFIITQHPASLGLSVTVRLIKLAGPVFGDVTDSIQDMPIKLSEFLCKLDDTEILKLVLDILSYTRVKVSVKEIVSIDSASLDSEFAGEYETLIKLIWRVISENRFFGKKDIGSLIKKFLPVNQNPVSTEDLTKS
jgi:hypothetical protein